MKQIIITVLAITCFAFVSSSQQKTLETAKIKTPNALCEACKPRIENYVKRTRLEDILTGKEKAGSVKGLH